MLFPAKLHNRRRPPSRSAGDGVRGWNVARANRRSGSSCGTAHAAPRATCRWPHARADRGSKKAGESGRCDASNALPPKDHSPIALRSTGTRDIENPHGVDLVSFPAIPFPDGLSFWARWRNHQRFDHVVLGSFARAGILDAFASPRPDRSTPPDYPFDPVADISRCSTMVLA